jgi:valyl-tRNA synthetase
MTITPIEEGQYDHEAIEKQCRALWDEAKIHDYKHDPEKEVFSIDTPPPYVSAAHLHVGHAMSYSQAEFLVRYKRMKGYNIFYPMGFDDNGLPTERFVEKTHNVNKKKISREDFRKLCIEETEKGGAVYEELWRALGLSVDWNLKYSTINERCRKTAQMSFIDLYNKDLVYRSDEPVLWDTQLDSALAQADLETLDRKSKLFDVQFSAADGTPLVISTTRPELLPGCVALYFNPADDRYKHLEGKKAVVPMFEHEVEIRTSEDVDIEFGTGLMMVCTFGDGEDVKKWKNDKLDTRIAIDRHGKMTALAGKYEGTQSAEARSHIVKDLKALELIVGEKNIDQKVSVGERSGTPVEFVMEPQWFIKVLGHEKEFLKRMNELEWFPEHMKVRLQHWVEGLKYDWNISRQRFYGVPFPIWYVEETGEVILPEESDLPVDPLETEPPKWAQEKYKGMTIVGESDVFDTWMTSSMSPQINANWAGVSGQEGSMDKIFPMSLRVQGFEIIRTWLFYTLIKAHYHQDSLPWKTAMISGWGLNEQGKKISKRDMEKFTDKDGYNRYDPYSVMQKFGADALRHWAAGSRLGQDLRFQEKDVKAGRKIVVKLWNVARFVTMQLEGYDPTTARPALADRTAEDRWLLSQLNRLTKKMSDAFEQYDYATAREALEKFFWQTLCDNYIEIVKQRFWEPEKHDPSVIASSQATLYEALRRVLSLFAPFLPFVTEGLYQRVFKSYEDDVSLHVSSWPEFNESAIDEKAEAQLKLVLNILHTVRALRTQAKVSQNQRIKTLTLDIANDDLKSDIKVLEPLIASATLAENIGYDVAGNETDQEGLKLDIQLEIKEAS